MKKTVKELITMYNTGKLHTNQSTQRDFIYLNSKDAIITNAEQHETTRAGDVITSILFRRIKMPALTFFKVTDNGSAADEYNLTDGKQRFTSIYEFVRGNLTCKDMDGENVTAASLSDEQKKYLLNYEFDIVECEGTSEDERKYFLYTTSSGLPLTEYESLKGAFHGKYFETFESALIEKQKQYTNINQIGRGEQALHILYAMLDCICLDPKVRFSMIQKNLTNSRDAEFRPEAKKFDKFIEIIDKFTGDHRLKITRACEVAYYILNSGVNIEKAVDYITKGLATDYNDIPKWKLDTFKSAIEALENGINCDYKRMFTKSDKDELYKKSKNRKCKGCGRSLTYTEANVDHIVPWSKGGKTELANAQLLCQPCNSRKGNR